MNPSNSGVNRQWILAGAVVACCLLLLALRPALGPKSLFINFDAFYCGGAALDHGADPYRAEPLGSCERAPKPLGLYANPWPSLALPAPLPPYALALFGLLARLPYGPAAAIWALAGLTALGLAAVGLTRLTGLSPGVSVAAVALSVGYAAFPVGQVMPVVFAAVVLSAQAMARGDDRRAALLAPLAMLEPHVGLPCCLGLFMWRPRTRPILLAAAGACLAIGIAAAGPALSFEYLAAVLPAHALAEAGNVAQLSTTYVAQRFGASPQAAVYAGELWYAAMVALGVWLGPKLARRTNRPAFIGLIPPAFAVIGGPFIHVVQVAVALPAALLLWQAAPARRRVLGIAIILLAIPWVRFETLGALFPVLAAIVIAVLVVELVAKSPISLAVGCIGGIGFIVLLWSWQLHNPFIDPTPALDAHNAPAAFADAGWAIYIRAASFGNAALYELAKLPTWLGVALFAQCAIADIVTANQPQRKRARAPRISFRETP